MKKVLGVALLCAVSSFAAWDKFPVLGDGKGEAKAGFSTSRQGYGDPVYGGFIGVRYNPLQNLELLAIQGLGEDYVLGARYQIIPVLAAGVDVGFPIPGRTWSFTPSVQFSMDFIPGLLSFGSNVGVSIYTEDKLLNKYSRGLDLDAGIELDLTIGKSTVWVGFDAAQGITRSEVDGKEISLKEEGSVRDGEFSRGLVLKPSVGYIANVGDNLALGTWVELGFGDKDMGYGENFNTTVGVDFSVKF